MTPQQVTDFLASKQPPVEPKPENAPAWLLDQLVRASRMPVSRQTPHIRGVVAHVSPAVVWVTTDSLDRRLLAISGRYDYVPGLKIGDKVDCWYRIHPSGLMGGWTCRRIE
jgi:hypothetical protein